MHHYKKIFQIIILFFSVVIYSQTNEKDSLRGDFTYLLKVRLNTETPNYLHEELFSLQIGENRAFFVSLQSVKRDSVVQIVGRNALASGNRNFDFRGHNVPKTAFPYTIIQSNDDIEFIQKIGIELFSYKEPVIRDWKLVNETKTINSIKCNKAEVEFKGRKWTAWYSADIPFHYGPYKFSGLPGLIIKLTDQNEDYDFELVKSVPNSKLQGKQIWLNEKRYKNPIVVTQEKFLVALENFKANPLAALGGVEISITDEQRKMILERQKTKKKGENPIELSE